MKRIDVLYDGQLYSIANRDIEELSAEILTRVQASEAFWLEVNSGEGQPRPTHILMAPGTAVALIPIPEDQPEQE